MTVHSVGRSSTTTMMVSLHNMDDLFGTNPNVQEIKARKKAEII